MKPQRPAVRRNRRCVLWCAMVSPRRQQVGRESLRGCVDCDGCEYCTGLWEGLCMI
jgi:hypothetical protein